jgi:P-type Cu+ transporter
VRLAFLGTFPSSFRSPEGLVAVYFEAAAAIVTLVLLGQVLELRARGRTGSAIRALLGLAPKQARRVSADGREQDVPLALHPFNRLKMNDPDRECCVGISVPLPLGLSCVA